MAQRVVIELTDDLDDTVIKDGKGETVRFALDNTDYEIDLSAKNAAALRKTLSPFVGVASKVGRKTNTRGKRTQVGPAPATIREWALANGHAVPDRGRIPNDIREAFLAAN